MSEEKTNKTGKKGREHYSSAILMAKRERKREEAADRQSKYSKLSFEQRLKLARSRRGESKREVARIEKQMKEQKAPAPKTAPLTEEQKTAKVVKHVEAVAKAEKSKYRAKKAKKGDNEKS